MQNVLVTGSSSGIGLAIAEHLMALGYKVLTTGRRQIERPDYFKADLTKRGELDALINYAEKYLGCVDILVNNAGEYLYAPVEKVSQEELLRLASLNFLAPYTLVSKLVPDMKKNRRGRIVNIGSISGAVGEANASLYSATKSALSGLTKSLGLELAQDNITVNLINPGWVETPLADMACENSEFDKDTNLEIIPQKRFIEPIEVAYLVEYLISEKAKGITGQSINLCAGLSIG